MAFPRIVALGPERLCIKVVDLAQFVSLCETPMTIGIQGEWGSGKTSLMNMIQGHIEAEGAKRKEESIHFLRFETWQYGALGNDDLLGLHLMRDMTSRIASFRPGDGNVVSQSGRLGKLFTALATATAAGTTSTLTGGLVDGASMVQGAQAAFGSERARAVGGTDLAHIKRVFGELVTNVTVSKPKSGKNANKQPESGRFVICIDDLDRIRPGKAVAMLEVLKNFMDVEHCVFIVACDYDVVRRGGRSGSASKTRARRARFFTRSSSCLFKCRCANTAYKGGCTRLSRHEWRRPGSRRTAARSRRCASQSA